MNFGNHITNYRYYTDITGFERQTYLAKCRKCLDAVHFQQFFFYLLSINTSAWSTFTKTVQHLNLFKHQESYIFPKYKKRKSIQTVPVHVYRKFLNGYTLSQLLVCSSRYCKQASKQASKQAKRPGRAQVAFFQVFADGLCAVHVFYTFVPTLCAGRK